MAYLETVVVAGDTIEIYRGHSLRFGKGKKRKSPTNPTSEAQVRRNDREAERKLRWKINTNFTEADLHLVLSFRPENRPESEEDMVRIAKNYLARLKRLYKRAGQEVKWIYSTEIGKKGALHIHLIINRCAGIEAHTYQRVWGLGFVGSHPLDDRHDYSQLADYIIKQTSNALHEGRVSQRYHCSRNLKNPKITKAMIQRKTFARRPSRKNYQLVDSYEGVTEWGYEIQFYKFIRILRPMRS